MLSIAGLDPTGGAGILADMKTFAANQVYGMACVAALTVQNSQGAHSYMAVAPEFLEKQLESLLTDLPPRAVKLGMLGSAATVEVVARQLEKHRAPWVVLDPVWKATSGAPLMDAGGWQALRERLLPLVSVVTPNVEEAAELAGQPASTQMADLEQAAMAIRALGPRYVVITGGHLERPTDLLFDGEKFITMAGDRVRTPNTHGTGCTFSAALAANLANGKQMQDAVVLAKAYLTAALKQAYAIGAGPGPLNHLYRLQEAPVSRNVEPAPLTTHTTR
ncbi:MAG TPA: bifunctional hydroxymethylpyrimidine kinase/phosphomethylpyrimidine kinase [Terriglobales bacterium]|nr:bifunctional hydroxymethylpyrimidine kinase/phosphomethylpyrimidine kinase [Terriglobales bacterium]